MAVEKEATEKKEKETAKKSFGDFTVTENEKGGHWKGRQEIVEKKFKDAGITKDTAKKVFGVVNDIHGEMHDFCTERVCETKAPASLELPVFQGLSITANVRMRDTYAGIARIDADGNELPKVPSEVYGQTKVGMAFSITGDLKNKVEENSAKIKSACEDFCKARDKEKAAAKELAAPK